MKPILIRVPELDNTARKYGIRKLAKFDKYDIKKAEERGIDRIYYMYYTGDYEGGGEAVYISNKKRYYKDLGHCSCFGPLEDMDEEGYDTIEEALNKSKFTDKQKKFILKDYK